MKVLLLYFTGTGNTGRCADRIRDSFIAHGHEVVSYQYRFDKGFAEDIESFDMLGIGYPIHAFNVPEAFNAFLKTLPNADKPYFIFKVSGEPFHFNDASSYHFAKRLKKKGYRRIAEKHFLMPYNIIFRYKDGIAKQMALYLDCLCEAFVRGILENRPELLSYPFDKKVLSFFLRIEWIAPKVNAPFVHMKKKKCTKCGLCMKQCPTGAISIKKSGKYKVAASKCAMCMKCCYSCPQDAITFGIMNPWKVNGPFKYDALISNQDIDPRYIHEGMKGYFKHFVPYFKKQDEILMSFGIDNPLDQQSLIEQ